MILLKSKDELKKMAEAGKIVKAALEKAAEAVRPGISTKEYDAIIESVITSAGATPSFKGYNGFPSCCCVSPNDVVVHGIPSRDTILREGDIVSVDVGAFFHGYHADAARTFAVGAISDQAKRLIDVTRECFFEGAKMAVPGGRIGDIGAAVQAHAEAAGYSVVRELVGHGVGKNLHESPDVPNFGRAGHGVRLSSGMVIAIEPMINMGAKEVAFSQEDGWTVRTKDHSLSAHYENTVAITSDGPVFFTL